MLSKGRYNVFPKLLNGGVYVTQKMSEMSGSYLSENPGLVLCVISYIAISISIFLSFLLHIGIRNLFLRLADFQEIVTLLQPLLKVEEEAQEEVASLWVHGMLMEMRWCCW